MTYLALGFRMKNVYEKTKMLTKHNKYREIREKTRSQKTQNV